MARKGDLTLRLLRPVLAGMVDGAAWAMHPEPEVMRIDVFHAGCITPTHLRC
jgi:hypothetical protein